MEEYKIEFIAQALKYAEMYIEKTGLEIKPCELLAFTMAYHLWIELGDENMMEMIKNA